MIALNPRQAYRKELILKGIDGSMSSLEIASRLYICQRQVNAIKKKYLSEGDSAFVHKLTGKPSHNKLPKHIVDKIISIKKDKCLENVNFSHFFDIISDNYGISVSKVSVYNIMKGSGFASPKKHKIKKQEKTHLMRPRKESFGELVQADGSSFDWFRSGKMYCIQGFVDDATGIPIGLHMTKNECLSGYLEATRMMLKNHGIPEQMYPDRSGIFFNNQQRDKNFDERNLTQYGRIMKELGVDMFPAYSPQAKGRIERFWQTIQSRLPIELKLRGIQTVENANLFLPEFIKMYSKRFGVKPFNPESKFSALNLEDINKLNDILVVKIKRKTDSSGVVSLFGTKFLIQGCYKKDIFISLSEQEGIYAVTVNGKKKYNVELLLSNKS